MSIINFLKELVGVYEISPGAGYFNLPLTTPQPPPSPICRLRLKTPRPNSEDLPLNKGKKSLMESLEGGKRWIVRMVGEDGLCYVGILIHQNSVEIVLRTETCGDVHIFRDKIRCIEFYNEDGRKKYKKEK